VVLTDYRTLPSVNVHTPVVIDTREPKGACLTVTDLDSGEVQPLDHPAWDNEANQWLNDIMELLEDPLKDHEELKDLLMDLSPDDWEQWMEDVRDPSFDLDDFVSMSPDDMNDVIEDMSLDEWEAWMEDVHDQFDLDDFVS